MPIYKFRIDTIHLPGEFDDMFDDLQTVDVSITEKEAADLITARKEWFASEDFKNSDAADDEEYFLHRYVPSIHAKVRKAIEEQAPSIWGEEIKPYISQLGIYCPQFFDEW